MAPARLAASVPTTPPATCDLLVVGGGINGVGIARDAAGRGVSVVLAEQSDLAAATSSTSTKLIHGGLRYLEYYEFGLVRKSLAEREVLLRAAPHIIWPLRFVLPHLPGMRPRWMIRAGLFLYDNLARRQWLPGTETVDLRRHVTGVPLQKGYRTGFMYSDGWVDDARLVVTCAMDAAARGATVLTRTACVAARRDGDAWVATLRDTDGRERTLRARALVNAAGPWAERFLRDGVQGHGDAAATRTLRLVKGSHIVVPKLFDHPYAYIFQGTDGRIVFAIPFERDFTLVGTTEVDHTLDPGEAAITADEVAYLCRLVNQYFSRPISPADVVWSFAGVRPLLDDASGSASAVTRDYRLELDTAGPPLLTLWGGKLTTFRKLAEEATDTVLGALGSTGTAWTHGVPLPGGDLSAFIGAARRPDEDFARFESVLRERLPAFPPALLHRLARAYGSRIEQVLGGAKQPAQLGAAVAPGLYEAELQVLIDHEWARTGDDVLWRRSKLGLQLTPAQRDAVAAWMAQHVGR